MAPPFWKMPHLVKRLVSLTAQSWCGWWLLWRKHRRHVRTGELVSWERTVALRIRGVMIPATCRVSCEAVETVVELAVTIPNEQISAAATAALPDFQEFVFRNWDRMLSTI